MEYTPIIYVLLYYIFLFYNSLINIKLSDRLFKLLNVSFLIAIVLVSYNFVPNHEMDLYRYHNLLNSFETVSLAQAKNYGPYSNTPITQLFFFLISRLSNFSLFSAIPTAINFSLIFLAVMKFRKKFSISTQSIAFFVLGIISVASLFGIITGVRQNFSWVLLMYAIYYDYFFLNNNKVISLILYVLPVMVHLTTIPFVLIRFSMTFIKKFKFLKYLIIFWPVALFLFSDFFVYLPSNFQAALNTLEKYINITENPGSGVSPKQIVSTFGYLIYIYFAFNIRKNKDSLLYKHKNYFDFYIAVLIFGLSSIFIPTLYTRTFELVSYLSLPLMSNIFNTKFHFRRFFIIILLILYLLLFYYQDLNLGYFF